MNILEAKVTAKNVLAYWQQDENRAPFMGEMFFPNKRQVGLKFEFLKGKQGLPVALVSANFNTNVLYRDRIGVSTLSGKLPFFKEAYAVDEELRQDILTAKENYVNPLLSRVFDDTNELLDGADVTVERMRFQLITEGTVNIQENGVDKQYDYGFDSETQSKQVTWSSTTNQLGDLITQTKNYKKLTKKPAKYLVGNPSILDYLAKDPAIADYFAKANIAYPTDEEIQRYVEARTGLTFLLNDKQYLSARDFGGVAKFYCPEDRFTLLSTLDLGNTVYGTTPEEIDLGGEKAPSLTGVEVTAKGVAITTWKEVDPVNVNVKVSEIVCPTCPNIDQIFIVKIK